MTVTNEPGIYKAGRHGVRTENTMLIVPSQETEFGTYYKFEPLTLCPIDKEAILTDMLSDEEITWFNQYHEKVYNCLSPELNNEEREWLKRSNISFKTVEINYGTYKISKRIHSKNRTKTCYLADNATIIGDVVIGKDCSIWFNAVLRGDVNAIA